MRSHVGVCLMVNATIKGKRKKGDVKAFASR
jgi:hypothetical protein